MARGSQAAVKQCAKVKGSDRRCHGQPTANVFDQARVPLIPWAKASSRAKRAVVVANLAMAQPASSRNYSEEPACLQPAVAGTTYVEPFLESGGAIRGSGPRAF